METEEEEEKTSGARSEERMGEQNLVNLVVAGEVEEGKSETEKTAASRVSFRPNPIKLGSQPRKEPPFWRRGILKFLH